MGIPSLIHVIRACTRTSLKEVRPAIVQLNFIQACNFSVVNLCFSIDFYGGWGKMPTTIQKQWIHKTFASLWFLNEK